LVEGCLVCFASVGHRFESVTRECNRMNT
jgi:hypothetical protein